MAGRSSRSTSSPRSSRRINEGRSHVEGEPGLDEAVASAHAAGRLRATLDGAAAAREADVVVLIVPVMLDDEQQPDYRYMDAAVASIAPGVHGGSVVIFETTLPVGDTRSRFTPRLEEASGLLAERDFFVAFSPERLYSGAALRNLATYPKLVGGIGPGSTDRAAAFYASVLDAEVVAMSSAEAAEFSKLADTTYRDVNIALANEFARYADRVGVDIQEVIEAANSQPYSHIHQPGIGVGGHCIPVYPHFLLSRAPEMELVELSRRVNDGQVGLAIRAIQKALGGLEGVAVLVLGLTYREGVKELAYSRALPLIERLSFHGAIVSAWDPHPVRRGDRALLRDRLALGRSHAGPGDRHPDGRPAVPRSRLGPGSPSSSCCSTGGTSCAMPFCRHGSRITASASRVPGGSTRLDRRAAAESDPAPRPSGEYRLRRRDAAPADQGGGAPARCSAPGTTRCSSTPASTGTRRWRAPSSASSGCAPPDHWLGVGGGTHAEQTGRHARSALEPILIDARPDAVLVFGDTNSTLAGALAAAKLGDPGRARRGGPAQLRPAMPEEINRVVADHLSRWSFAPTPTAVANLAPRASPTASSSSAT